MDFGANQCQISNTIITPSLVICCVSACALYFNEEVYFEEFSWRFDR